MSIKPLLIGAPLPFLIGAVMAYLMPALVKWLVLIAQKIVSPGFESNQNSGNPF